jgi:mannose-1-phosphate guanylyltransferase
MSRRVISLSIDTAVILAAGLGRRLHPLTLVIPKSMLPIADKPILEYIIEWLRKNGITDVIICTGYLSNMIEGYFSDGSKIGVNVRYAKADRLLGTAGQLKYAESLLNTDRFLCVYGDALYNFDLKGMFYRHENSNSIATIALVPYRVRLPYGFICIDDECMVTSWDEKPTIKGLINIGCYIMEKEFLSLIPDTPTHMNTVFIDAINKGRRISAYVVDEDAFKDIGDKRSYMKVYREYMEMLGYDKI